ncbi:MAG: sugar ABC transporter permease [Caldilineales bacterium]
MLRDRVFWKAFGNTVFYIVTIVPLQLAIGLAIAVALNTAIRARDTFRMVYFLPVVTTIVAGAIVFRLILSKTGPLAGLVSGLGDLVNLPLALPDMLGSRLFQVVGGDPDAVEERGLHHGGLPGGAARGAAGAVRRSPVDGASGWQRFRNVTWPLISPTTFFLFILQTIGAFQLFTEPFVMTRGGPAQSSMPVVQYIYDNAFRFARMGKASAIAWFLFIFIFGFTLVQNIMQRRWVHYETGDALVRTIFQIVRHQ